MCLVQLADLAEAQGRLDHAVELHRRALSMRQETLHPHHSNIRTSLAALARLLLQTGQPAEAERLWRRP